MRLDVLAPCANTVAAELTGRDYLSYSQITLFQKCPLRWHFQYVEGLPAEVVGSSLVFGGAVHSAIEYLYRARLAGQDVPPLAKLMAVFDAAWKEDACLPIVFGKGETAASLRSLAERMLAMFPRSDPVHAGGRIVAVEQELCGEILPGVPDLLARIDLILQANDALIIRDFKTSRSRWGQIQRDDAAPQLLLYGELAQDLAQSQDLPIRLEFVVLTKTNCPSVEVHAVPFDSDQLERTKAAIQGVWSAMQAGHVYPNPSPMNCHACPHQRACREWRG